LWHELVAPHLFGTVQEIEKGATSFAKLEEYILKNGEAKRFSGKQEAYEQLVRVKMNWH
jgi:xylose isomerase